MSATREVTLDQGTIRYRDTGGDGDPIVFVHGALVNGRLWEEVVPLLEGHHRCVVPDLPLGSHELPMRPEADLSPPGLARLIADFLAALDLERVTLVANDTGGAISQLVAVDHPERLARLVLTNCDAFENFLPPAFRYLQLTARMPGGIFVLAQSMRLRAMRRMPVAYGWLTRKRLSNELLDEWVAPLIADRDVRRDARKLLRGISKEYTLDAAARFGEFTKPVLLAWGPEDRFFTWAFAERLAQAFPDARLERVEDCTTFVSLDQPERLAELIEAFVAQTAAAPVRA